MDKDKDPPFLGIAKVSNDGYYVVPKVRDVDLF